MAMFSLQNTSVGRTSMPMMPTEMVGAGGRLAGGECLLLLPPLLLHLLLAGLEKGEGAEEW